jgi:hypothetical protein
METFIGITIGVAFFLPVWGMVRIFWELNKLD